MSVRLNTEETTIAVRALARAEDSVRHELEDVAHNCTDCTRAHYCDPHTELEDDLHEYRTLSRKLLNDTTS